MARHHRTPMFDDDGKWSGDQTVPFSQAEETARDAEEAAWEADAVPRNAMSELLRLEALESPRRMAEAQLTDEGKAWLQANRDAIAVERAKL